MIKKVVVVIFISLSLSIWGYQWPSNKAYLKSFFGSIFNESIQDGIRFTGSDQAIYPLTNGEIIFYQDSFEFGDLDYKGAEGNILVLKHKGDFKSVYRNFQPIDSFDFDKIVVDKQMLGITSKKYDKFLFSVYDDVKQSYINPQQILPFLNDDIAPVINGVYIKNRDKTYKISRNKVIPIGDSILYIDAWDVVKIAGRYRKFSPFNIYVFIDGFEKYHISYSSIKEIDDKVYLSGDEDVAVEELLSGEGFLYGGAFYLTRGKSLIEVVVKDIYGNEASKSYSVVVGL